MPLINVANRFQHSIRKPADGTQPTSAWGTTITADATAHVKGAWTDVIVAADWSGFTGDAYEIEIMFTNAFASATNVRVLADIGVDSGGGYSSVIDNLNACHAADWAATAPVCYRFPLKITNGVKVGCRIQSSIASQTIKVSINVYGNPTNPELVRAGTFVRTFGADTANSTGTAVTAGTTSEGAWTQITASTSDALWYWECGYSLSDAATSASPTIIDLGAGAASSEVKIAEGIMICKSTAEAIAKPLTRPFVHSVASGTRLAARIQTATLETTEAIIVYGVGGDVGSAPTSGGYSRGRVVN